jgi:hypothetical protein
MLVLSPCPCRYGALAVKFAQRTNKIEMKIRALNRLIKQEKQQVAATAAASAAQ